MKGLLGRIRDVVCRVFLNFSSCRLANPEEKLTKVIWLREHSGDVDYQQWPPIEPKRSYVKRLEKYIIRLVVTSRD